MKYKFDAEADAIYISFSRKKYSHGEDLDRERRIDYGADGIPIGVELLSVSSGVTLQDLPRREEIEEILRQLNIKVYA